MDKLSYDDKMRIQTLREQRLEPKAIMKTNLRQAEAFDRQRTSSELANDLYDE